MKLSAQRFYRPLSFLTFTFLLCTCVASAEEFTDTVRKQFTLPPADGTLTVQADYGHIEFKTGDSNTITVEVKRVVRADNKAEAQRIFDDFELLGSPVGNMLVIEGKFKEGWQPRGVGRWRGHGWNNCRGVEGHRDEQVCLTYAKQLRQHSYTITIPRKLDLSVRTEGGHLSIPDIDGQLFARTAGGHIEAGNVTGLATIRTAGGHIQMGSIGGKAELETAGGHIMVRDVKGDLNAETAGGSITTGDVEGKVRAETAGGSISIDSAKGSIQAHTSGGSISARFAAQPNEDSELETSGGSVRVSFSNSVHVNVEAESNSGRVTSDFDGLTSTGGSRRWESGELKGPINGGGPRVRISTSSGSVHITRSAI